VVVLLDAGSISMASVNLVDGDIPNAADVVGAGD
jgi:hypothetical protein